MKKSKRGTLSFGILNLIYVFKVFGLDGHSIFDVKFDITFTLILYIQLVSVNNELWKGLPGL